MKRTNPHEDPKSSSGTRLAVSRSEWQEIGRKQGWLRTAEDQKPSATVEMLMLAPNAFAAYVDGRMLGVAVLCEGAADDAEILEEAFRRLIA